AQHHTRLGVNTSLVIQLHRLLSVVRHTRRNVKPPVPRGGVSTRTTRHVHKRLVVRILQPAHRCVPILVHATINHDAARCRVLRQRGRLPHVRLHTLMPSTSIQRLPV